MQNIYLNVPYAQKDEARILGARWDPDLRKWYITGQQDAMKFIKWFSKTVETNVEVLGDRVTLKEFLSANYGTAVSLTFKSARAFGIPYPLESGWAKKYANRTALCSSVTVGKRAKPVKAAEPAKVHAPKPVITNPVVFVPLCNCTTPPWEDCEHTDALAEAAMNEILHSNPMLDLAII